jgi:hypothetical protein
LSYQNLCTQKEANGFSLWNNNLGYQGILEFRSLQVELIKEGETYSKIKPNRVNRSRLHKPIT